MSFLEQPMSNLASDRFHSTVWPQDLKVCKLCVSHNSHNKCNGDGCERIDVFGDGACNEIKFVRHADDKLYCPSCIEDVWEEEEEAQQEQAECDWVNGPDPDIKSPSPTAIDAC